MKVVSAAEVSTHEVNADGESIRTGTYAGKRILTEDAPDGLNFVFLRNEFHDETAPFLTPRHRHTFAQIKFLEKGASNYAPEQYIEEGGDQYSREWLTTGRRSKTAASASGCSSASTASIRKAQSGKPTGPKRSTALKLAARSLTANTRMSIQSRQTRVRDGVEAIYEEQYRMHTGNELVTRPAGYDSVILMSPKAFAWFRPHPAWNSSISAASMTSRVRMVTSASRWCRLSKRRRLPALFRPRAGRLDPVGWPEGRRADERQADQRLQRARRRDRYFRRGGHRSFPRRIPPARLGPIKDAKERPLKIVQTDEVPVTGSPRVRGGSGHRSQIMFDSSVLGRDPNRPDNFFMQISYLEKGQFSSPRHRHNFEQIRYMISGEEDYPEGKMTDGTLGYFPEGAYYNQENMVGTIVILQFGGPSGSGFVDRKQMKAAFEEMKASNTGVFKDGTYYRNPGVQGPPVQDGNEAMIE